MIRRKTIVLLVQLSIVVFYLSMVNAEVVVEDEEIVFRYKASGASDVYLVGDFNGWNPTIDKMVRVGDYFEIRLFLLPGRYSYRFIVDGKSVVDPDNPALDEKGNSVFFLSETNGYLRIDFKEVKRLVPGETGSERDIGGFINYYGLDEALFSRLVVLDSVGTDLKLSFRLGFKGWINESDGLRGRLRLINAEGYYYNSGLKVRAFFRTDSLGVRDGKGLFSSIGPYNYGLGLFSYGVLINRSLPFNSDVEIFYANRFDGFLHDEFIAMLPPDSSANLVDREPVDSDFIGLTVSSGVQSVKLDYIFKWVKRPVTESIVSVNSGGLLFKTFEKVVAHGISLGFPLRDMGNLRMGYFKGRNKLVVFERSVDSLDSFYDYNDEFDLERYTKVFLGYSYWRNGLEIEAQYSWESLKPEPEIQEKGEESVSSYSVHFCYSNSNITIGLDGMIEDFYNSSMRRFCTFGENFMLDDDEISVEKLPFLFCDGLYSIEATFSIGRNLSARQIFFVERDFTFKVRSTGEFDESGLNTLELRLQKDISLHQLCNFFLDMRYISYRNGGYENNYLDSFISYYIHHDRMWISLGIGVNPFMFDELNHRYNSYGRQRYIFEGLIDSRRDVNEESQLIETILDMESKMERDTYVRFEMGFSF